jgi:deoxycytidine triphosphate deaminase
VLSDTEIRAALTDGGLYIYTLPPETPLELADMVEDWQIQPVSVDLTLGGVGTADDPAVSWGQEEGGPRVWFVTPWFVSPGAFVLGCTREVVQMPTTLAGVVAGKSSLARRGIQVEAAGLVDPGFRGQLTLEIVNFTDKVIDLREGMPICQLSLHRVDGVVQRPYGSKGLRSRYQGQMGPTGARPDPDEEGPTT